MSQALDDLLEKSIRRITLRLSTAEEEFLKIAGNRLAETGALTAEQARKYLYSAGAAGDAMSDLNKIKRILAAAHTANIKDLNALYDDITGAVWDDAKTIGGVPGQQFPPLAGFKKNTGASPLFKAAARNYRIMAQSTAVNAAYRKTINSLVQKMSADEGRLNFPGAMRQAVRELTAEGISIIDYKSGHRQRMDSAARRDLMGEFTQIVQQTERSLAGEIGADGWEISAHQHCAEDHEPLQGHIFTDDEFEKLQNGEPAKDIDGEAFQTDRAIGEWNCRHIAYPFIIGISEPSFSKEALEEIKTRNEEGAEFHGKRYSLYEAEQLQRRYETEMRKEREQGNLYKQVMETDPALRGDYRKSRERLGALRDGYKELGEVLAPKAMRMKMERSYVPKKDFVNEIPGLNVTKKELMKSAYEPINRGGVSQVGRAFQKHAFGKDRSGIIYGEQTGKATDNTMQGAYFLDKILNSKELIVRTRTSKAYGDYTEISMPNGLGARWTADGKRFIGFIEPSKEKK